MKNFSKYLISTSAEQEWGLFVTAAGYSKIDINENYPPNSRHPASHAFNWDTGRILDGYYLVFISNGSGSFESACTGSSRIGAGTCFMLFPGVWHRYKPDAKSGWEEYWVGFKGDYAVKLATHFFDAENPFFNTDLNDNLLKLFHELFSWLQQAPVGYPQIIAGVTLQMLGLLYAVTHQKNAATNNALQLVAQAKFLLREHLQEAGSVASVLKKLPVSYSKLRKDFKNVTGLAPNQYQLTLRLDKARDLLTSTNLNIAEIAYQTGFESAAYLSKIFKKKAGISPVQYRNNRRQHT